MTTFAAIVAGLGAAFLLACLLLGVLYPGTGADRLFKERPAGPVGQDETAALLAATNAKRAAHGKPPLTRADLER